MSITDFVESRFAWAFNKRTLDGHIEEIVAVHLARVKKALADEFKQNEFTKIYKKIRNPSKEAGIRAKVAKSYDKGKYNKQLPEAIRNILSYKSSEDIGPYKRYADEEVGIGFIIGSAQGVMKYCPLISRYSEAAIKNLYYILEGVNYQGNGDDLGRNLEQQLSKEEKKRFKEIEREIKEQNKEHDINYAIQVQVEANSVEDANKIVDKYTGFIKAKARFKLHLRPAGSSEGKFRAVYTLQVTDPVDYNVQSHFSEQGARGLMDICLNEIVKRKCNKEPGKDANKVKQKLCNTYMVNYLFWKIKSPASLLKSIARKKLMEELRTESLNWIYGGIVENVMKAISESKKEISYKIDGNPFSSIIIKSKEYRCRIKILPWYNDLKESMPNEEFFDSDCESIEDFENTMERELRKEWTKKWDEYMEKQGYFGTQVILVRYKDPRTELDPSKKESLMSDRNTIFRYSLLPSWFLQSSQQGVTRKK